MKHFKEKVQELGEAGDDQFDPWLGALGEGGYGGSIGRPQRSKTRAPLLQLGNDLEVLHDVHARIFDFKLNEWRPAVKLNKRRHGVEGEDRAIFHKSSPHPALFF